MAHNFKKFLINIHLNNMALRGRICLNPIVLKRKLYQNIGSLYHCDATTDASGLLIELFRYEW